MHSRRLGPNGPHVSMLALGGHEYLADGKSRGFNEDIKLAVSPGHIGQGYGGAKRQAVVRAAYDLGINFFDVTIDSEKEALGRHLKAMPPPHEIYIQTRPEGMCYSYDPGNRKMLDGQLLRAEVQRGLKLLGRETLDFLNIGLLAWSIDGDPGYLPTLAGNLQDLKREGLVRWVVADSFSGERLYLAMIESGAFDVLNTDLNVGDACVLDRVVPAARSRGLGVVAREAFLKGELFRIGASIGCDDKALLARVALKFVLVHEPDSLIVGVDNVEQLLANATTLESPSMTSEEEALLARLRQAPSFVAYESAKRREFMEGAV